jgi:hypothetical protein
MITFKQFLDLINNFYNEGEYELRYGQILMNTLYQYWPEKYNQITHTEYDCFYEDGWSYATSQTLRKLQEEWPNA